MAVARIGKGSHGRPHGSGALGDIGVNDLSIAGFFGLHSDGMYGTSGINGDFNAMEAFTVRYVGGQRRLICATTIVNGSYTSGWASVEASSRPDYWISLDLWECSFPSSLDAAAPSIHSTAGIPYVNLLTNESSKIVNRRWDAREWRPVGAAGHNGVHIGFLFMDPNVSNRLWYSMEGNYSNGPMPSLGCVDLLDTAGTYGLACTKYGPWHIANCNTVDARWKEMSMRITEIPASEKTHFGNKDYLFGATNMSQSSQYSPIGPSVVAMNLPSVTGKQALDGRFEADNIGAPNGTTFYIYRADASLLSSVPTDGTACFYFAHPNAGINFQQFIVPTSLTYDSGNSRWVIAGNAKNVNGGGGNVAMDVMAGGSTRVDWAVNWIINESEVLPIARYSEVTGLGTDNMRAQRNDTLHYRAQDTYDLQDDPYFGARGNVIAGHSTWDTTGGGNAIAGQRMRAARSGSTTTIQFAADASSSDDAYNNLTVYNHTTLESRTISDYVGSTRTATVSGVFGSAVIAGTVYTVRFPTDINCQSGSTSANVKLPTGSFPPINDGVMVDCLVTIRNDVPTNAHSQARRITAWDAATGTATLDASWSITPTSGSTVTVYSYWVPGFRRFNPTGTPTSTTVQLPIGAASDDDAYNGMYLRCVNNTPSGAFEQALMIYDYVGSTRTCTVGSQLYGGASAFAVVPTTSTQMELQVWDPLEFNFPTGPSPVGRWNIGLDEMMGFDFIKTPTKCSLVGFGKAVTGAAWYHAYDTYASWNNPDTGLPILSRDNFETTYSNFSNKCEFFKPILWVQKLSELRAAAANSSLANANGVLVYDGGNWRGLAGFETFAHYGANTTFTTADSVHLNHTAWGGGGQMVRDKTANQTILALRWQYHSEGSRVHHPIFVVINLPVGTE